MEGQLQVVSTGYGESPARVDMLAADGGIVELRPARSADRTGLTALYQSGSLNSLVMRFFGPPGKASIAREVERLTRPADAAHEVLVAEEGGLLIGVGSYERCSQDATAAEFALFVNEAHHGRGIGTLLLERLSTVARKNGIGRLTGEVLGSNNRMLRVVKDLGGAHPLTFDHGITDVTLATTVDSEATDARDRVAETASLHALFAPRSVAVVGVGRQPGGVGHATLASIVEYGFTGTVFAVNPHVDKILGVPCYPTLREIPGGVDLAIIAVPAAAVAAVLEDAASAGVRAAVVLSSGFDELPDSERTQAELVRIARRHGIRLVGPNCLGVLTTAATTHLAATFSPVLPPAGSLALASQSGAVGIAVLDHVSRTGLGLSAFVSLGNKADVSGNDLLAYWFDDPETKAVALYLESFGNPRRFARIARALARRKPVIAVVSGRSVAGQRAGASHTAAAASPALAVDTLCAQAGVIRVDHLGELLDTARMLTEQPLPRGHRLGIVGNAGGVNVLAADAAESAGLHVPELSANARMRLATLAPGAGNPFDLGAGASPESLAGALDVLADSGEVDAVLVVVAATRANSVQAILSSVGSIIDGHPTVPVAIVVIGSAEVTSVGRRGAPVFDLPERAVAALGRAAWYSAWRRQPLGRVPTLSNLDIRSARATVDATLPAHEGWQPQDRITSILEAYGIPVVPTALVTGTDEVLAAARRIGYPVVLKAADPDVVHKTDIGGVKLNLIDEDAVRQAYQDLSSSLSQPNPTALVQPMAAGHVELLAGIVHDRLFGSLVLVGMGGVHTELFADRALRLVPVTDLDATSMWRDLRAARLLTGYRGATAVDTGAIEDLLLRLGRLAEDLPEVVELDLNPVLVTATGLLVVDAKMRLAAAADEPDATSRVLRMPG